MVMERDSRTRPTHVADADGQGFDPEAMLPEQDAQPPRPPEDPFDYRPENGRERPTADDPRNRPPENGHRNPAYPEDPDTGYAALDIIASDPETLSMVINENLGDSGLTMNDLRKVTVPSGGGRHWQVPAPGGDESVQSIEGIIVHRAYPRSWWEQSVEESPNNRQPDCYSPDGLYGRPGPQNAVRTELQDGSTVVECATCPLNVWGSGRNGRGKACQEKQLLFLLQPHSILPMVVQAPPTSIPGIKEYMVQLVDNRDFRPYWQVVTRLELETVKGDLNYSRILFSRAGSIDKRHMQQLQDYRKRITPVLDQLTKNMGPQILLEPVQPEPPALAEGRPQPPALAEGRPEQDQPEPRTVDPMQNGGEAMTHPTDADYPEFPEDPPYRDHPDETRRPRHLDEPPYQDGPPRRPEYRDDREHRQYADDREYRQYPDDREYRQYPDDREYRQHPDEREYRQRPDEREYRQRPDEREYRPAQRVSEPQPAPYGADPRPQPRQDEPRRPRPQHEDETPPYHPDDPRGQQGQFPDEPRRPQRPAEPRRQPPAGAPDGPPPAPPSRPARQA